MYKDTKQKLCEKVFAWENKETTKDREKKRNYKRAARRKQRENTERQKKSGFGKNKRKKKEAKKTLCKKENVEKVFWCGNSEELQKGSVKMNQHKSSKEKKSFLMKKKTGRRRKHKGIFRPVKRSKSGQNFLNLEKREKQKKNRNCRTRTKKVNVQTKNTWDYKKETFFFKKKERKANVQRHLFLKKKKQGFFWNSILYFSFFVENSLPFELFISLCKTFLVLSFFFCFALFFLIVFFDGVLPNKIKFTFFFGSKNHLSNKSLLEFLFWFSVIGFFWFFWSSWKIPFWFFLRKNWRNASYHKVAFGTKTFLSRSHFVAISSCSENIRLSSFFRKKSWSLSYFSFFHLQFTFAKISFEKLFSERKSTFFCQKKQEGKKKEVQKFPNTCFKRGHRQRKHKKGKQNTCGKTEKNKKRKKRQQMN